MFRPMRRYKQQLSDSDCTQILKNEMRGTLAVIGDDDYPYAIPLSYYFSEDDNKIYFHGSREGHKIDAIKKCDKASFCVFGNGVKVSDRIGLDFKSVIVFGRIKILEDREKTLDICKKLSEKFNFGNIPSRQRTAATKRTYQLKFPAQRYVLHYERHLFRPAMGSTAKQRSRTGQSG